ncbi:MAG TPA: restriction endonuclease subunit S [Acidimicrobiales bacterium]|nr:restriction endonuclease subunit S [Acidimicrobiales bacterium]
MPTTRTAKTGDVPVLSVAALRNGDAPRRFVGRAEMITVGAALVNDVLLAVEGGTVGECFVVHEDLAEFVPSQQAATLRVLSTEEVEPWYLGAWLSSAEGQQRLGVIARGSTIQRIAFGDLEGLDVRIPQLTEQRRIGGRYRAFNESIRAHRAVAAELEELQRVEFALAFSGEEMQQESGPTLNQAALRRLKARATSFSDERLPDGPPKEEGKR